MFKSFLICAALAVASMAQSPRVPDLESQRAAMKKLNFLIGKWSGNARILRKSGEAVELIQTEEAQYKLDGLLLMIEGVGRTTADGKPALQALAIISYDDETGTYHMRAYNDGRYLETEVRLDDNGKELRWGFAVGEIRTTSALRLNDKGEWTEMHEISVGDGPPRKFMELTVRRTE